MTRSRPTRKAGALWWSGMLLSLAGLTATGLANICCGHEHLARGHARYHHHLYFASHEHHHRDAHPDRKHPEAPARQDREAPGKTVTVAPAPALFQPVNASLPAVPLAVARPLVPARALPLMVQPGFRPVQPRGPPVSLIAPDLHWEKGNPGCRL